MSTKVIQLEALVRPTPLIIKIGDVSHPMVAATVDTYIANMKDIESLSLNASPVEELELAVRLITRAFPSLAPGEIRGWSVDVIHQLAQIARGASGEVVSETEGEEPVAEGNDQPA